MRLQSVGRVAAVAGICGVVAVHRGGAQACEPAAPPSVRQHLALVQQALDTNPRNSVNLFRQAVDLTALCRDDEALAALERMAGSYGGLDPSTYRAFVRLHSLSRFREIIARIRRDNPPIIASSVAYTFARPTLFPEGIAYDSVTGRVYAGSTTGRNIVWTDRTGAVHELTSTGQDGLGSVLGLHIDARRHQLWAVSTGATGAGSAHVVRGLFQFDLTTGKLIARYAIPDTTSENSLNDVVVAQGTGIAYTTHTLGGTVYAATPGDTTLRPLLPTSSIPQVNGIALTPDESALLVAGGLGIVRVDLQTKRVVPLSRGPGVVDVTMDGLYRYRRSLIGIQNGVHPGRVMRFDLDSTWTHITRGIVLESYNPLFDGPTTGAIVDDTFLFIANPQNRQRLAPGGITDSTSLKPIQILRLPLRP